MTRLKQPIWDLGTKIEFHLQWGDAVFLRCDKENKARGRVVVARPHLDGWVYEVDIGWLEKHEDGLSIVTGTVDKIIPPI